MIEESVRVELPVPQPGAGLSLSEDLLTKLYQLLAPVYSLGTMVGHTDYETLSKASAWQRLYGNNVPAPRPVYSAIVQNLSTDPLTTSLSPDPGVPPSRANGQGTVLNPASVAGQAGGSHTYINIDLDEVWIIGATVGDAFSVEYYDFG